MSGREWKPGDVAMVEFDGESPVLAFRDGDSGCIGWSLADYRRKAIWIEHNDALEIRPLVVIDPEDREQIQRLAALLVAQDRGYDEDSALDLQHALREFANPTPPCGASLALGKAAVLYRCSESAGHAGPHVDGTQTWSVES